MTVCNLTYRGSVFCVTANQFAYPYPSLYLDSNVKIISGDGSESNPFTLSL